MFLSRISGFTVHRSLHYAAVGRELRPLRMAALSPTMATGHIQKWLHGEGEKVEAGDAFCDIETDKAVVGLDYVDDSVLVKIVKGEGSRDIQIGELIGWIADPKDDITNLKVPEKDPEPPTADGETTSTDRLAALSASINAIADKYDMTNLSSTERFAFSMNYPHVANSDPVEYMRKCGIELDKNGRESLTHVKATFKSIPVSTVRGIVASRLTLSKSTIPHEYGAIDCSIEEVMKLRKKLNAENKDVKISVNDFIVAAVAKSLKSNAHKPKGDVDVAVAVSIPDGLITPVVRKADTLSLSQISSQIKVGQSRAFFALSCVQELAAKAKERRLKPQQFQGSSFTVSNLGMFGIKSFSAVINPPEVGILAIGAGRLSQKSPQHPIDNLMNVTLSYDARAVTHTSAASFLNHVKDFIQNPKKLV